jgi:FixJ family two-component response regulator
MGPVDAKEPIVFVVDDDLSVREGIQSLLTSVGLSVERLVRSAPVVELPESP